MYVPTRSTWTNGFFIGSDNAGFEQARSAFFDLLVWGVECSGSYTNSWPFVSNALAAWQAGLGGGGGFGAMMDTGMGMSAPAGYSAGATYTTNYGDYKNFHLALGSSSSATNVVFTVQNTQSNLTYSILTNSVMDPNLADWGVWQTLTASNSVVVAPGFTNIGTNSMFFAAQLVLVTGTNQIADWWQMLYFNQLGIDPFADPDGDGLCNYSEYILGTNPTNAYSVSSLHNDAQAMFLAYTDDPNTRLLLSVSNVPGSNAVTLTLSNTFVGSNYQIYSKDLSDPNSAWRVETSFLGTNTATQITIALNGRTLDFIGGDGEDPDGDGLPSGYEVLCTLTDPLLADTGNTGIPDGYKDPDGDGFVNLQEYYNGTDPHVFNTPNAPGGLDVALITSGGSQDVSLTWNAPGGSATGYVILRDSGLGFVAIATNSAGVTSFIDYLLPTNGVAIYEIQAIYALGRSLITALVSAFSNPTYNFPMSIVNGPSNQLYLVVSAMPPGVTNFLVTRTVYDGSSYLGAFYPIDFQRWQQEPYFFSPAISSGTFSVPVASFSNGIALITTDQVPPYGTYDLSVQAVGADGKTGSEVDCWGPSVSPMFHTYGTVPFIDATAQMKNNLSFLMTVGNGEFDYMAYTTNGNADGWGWYGNYFGPEIAYPCDYVFASYFTERGAYDQFLPFEDNCVFSNFQYNAFFGTATNPCPLPIGLADGSIDVDLASTFPTYSYVVSSNLAPVPPSLVTSNNQWFAFPWFDTFWLPQWGVYRSGYTLYMTNGGTNAYGLPFLSFQLETASGPFGVLSPSQSFTENNPDDWSCFAYSQVAPPAVRTVDFYFARLANFAFQYPPGGSPEGTFYFPIGYYPTTASDPMPGDQDQAYFDNTNTTPLMIASVGQPLYIAGYAKQVATNGASNVFAYLGQYFTNAVEMQNGVLTTNQAGIVSEYGSFFPTLPGQIALLTKPAPDQGNLQGQCIINVIRLSLDVNHDGTMDESFTGPDNTSAGRPFVFWANNDYDRPLTNGAPGTDVTQSKAAALTPGGGVPDCDFMAGVGCYQIPCEGDLEDYTRVWLTGLSNLYAINPNLTFQLIVRNNDSPNGPAINVFQSVEPDGGIGYLTNEATAATQISAPTANCVGRVTPYSPLNLNAYIYRINGQFSDHFIWCGATAGKGELVFQVLNGTTLLAESSVFLDIRDIKDFYEATVLTETRTGAISNWTSGAMTVQYASVADANESQDIIVLVHGINVDNWSWINSSQTVFKRLYSSGYHGKFATVDWPCLQGLQVIDFNTSELYAYKAGTGMTAYLNQLRTRFPGYRLHLLVHSQGNAVVSEAIKQGAPFDTYILTEGALPASSYDANAPIYTALSNVELIVHTPDWQPMGYHGVYTNFTGRIVNFYNYYDPVLNVWIADQLEMKPNNFLFGADYFFDGTNSWHVIEGRPPLLVTDPQQARSMVSRSRTLPIGQSGPASGHGVINSAVDLNAQYGFYNAFPDDHSAQWTRPIQTAWGYYDSVLEACLIPTIERQ